MSAAPAVAAASTARSPAYDLVLLAHVLAALIGFGAVAVAGGYALTLMRSGSRSEAVRRYYRPGVNWAGRVLFLVPLLGSALIAMSHGRWGYSDGWVGLGLALWALAATVAEMALWPAERRLQAMVTEPPPVSDPGSDPGLRSLCVRVVVLAAVLLTVAVVAVVVMVGKP